MSSPAVAVCFVKEPRLKKILGGNMLSSPAVAVCFVKEPRLKKILGGNMLSSPAVAVCFVKMWQIRIDVTDEYGCHHLL